METFVSLAPPDRVAATREVEQLVRSGQVTSAVDALERQVVWWPDDGQRWANLVALYRRLRRPVRAAETLIRAFDVVPVAPFANVVTQLLADLPVAAGHRLGSAYLARGFHGGVAAVAVGLMPDGAERDAWVDRLRGEAASGRLEDLVYLATGLASAGRTPEAAAAARTVVDRWPGEVIGWRLVGRCARESADFAGARAAHERCRALAPAVTQDLINWAGYCASVRKLRQAEAACREALAIDPTSAVAHGRLHDALRPFGRVGEALHHVDSALLATPDSKPMLVARAATALYDEHTTPETFLAHARLRWTLDGPRFDHNDVDADPGRRLRVAFLSPDFRRHSVSYFVVRMFEILDREVVEVVAYAQRTGPSFDDDMTARIRAAVDAFVPTEDLDDDALSARLRADRIDVAIDLANLTDGSRLDALTRHPVPVQMSWLGLPCSTGNPGIDYMIACPVTVPPEHEGHFVERLLRMPHPSAHYTRPAEVPLRPSPLARGGGPVFGSFNNPCKYSDGALALWGRLLREIDGSTMLLKYDLFGDAENVGPMRERLVSLGVPVDRVTFEGSSPVAAYLDRYNDVDVCLDPFPFNGGTTSLAALSMGVPLVALAGDRFASRVGMAFLQELDRAEWIAPDADAYVRVVREITAMGPELPGIRADLRRRFDASSLGAPEPLARSFEDLVRSAWRAFCAGHRLGPTSAA